MENDTPNELSDVDWKNRTLCSDGNCIGVLGSDGRCKECGKPYDGAVVEATNDEEVEATTDVSNSIADDSPEQDRIHTSEGETDTEMNEELDDEWETRTLCSDGNCIGVIGPDGRCKECGKPYEA